MKVDETLVFKLSCPKNQIWKLMKL